LLSLQALKNTAGNVCNLSLSDGVPYSVPRVRVRAGGLFKNTVTGSAANAANAARERRNVFFY
jgi:hypothetical protein